MRFDFPEIDENVGAVELRVTVIIKSEWARDGKVYKTDTAEQELYFCYTDDDRMGHIEQELCYYSINNASVIDTFTAAKTYFQTMERKGDSWVTLDTPIEHTTKDQTLRQTRTVELGEIKIKEYTRVPVFFQKAFQRLPNGIDGWYAVRAGRYHYRRLQRHLGLSYYLGTKTSAGSTEHTLVHPTQEDGHIVLNSTFVRVV